MSDIVYIEQSHFSRMARQSLGTAKQDEHSEAELLVELRRLVAAGLIVCPFSMAHLIETAKLDTDPRLRTEIARIVDSVSVGRCFKWPFSLVPEEMTFAVGSASGYASAAVGHVGTGLDAMPPGEHSNAARIGIAAAKGIQPFQYLVGLANRNEKIRGDIEKFIDTMYAAEQSSAPTREQLKLTLDDARILERDSVVNGRMFSGWVQATAAKFGRSVADVEKLVLADDLAAIPTAAAMIEIRARKDIAYGRNLSRSDVLDTGHLLFLPHSDWYLTERYAANLARVPGQRTQTVVLARPRDLLEQLQAKFPQ